MTHSKSLQIIADALRGAATLLDELRPELVDGPHPDKFHEEDDIQKALALIPDIEAGLNGWRSIESAPKDRTRFLACMFTDYSEKRIILHTPDRGPVPSRIADTYVIFHLYYNDEYEKFMDYGAGEDADISYFYAWQPEPAKPLPSPPARAEKE